MKERIISAVCGAALVATVFLFNTDFPIGLNIIISIIAIIATYELQVATGYIENVFLTVLSFVVTAIVIFTPYFVKGTVNRASVISVTALVYMVILFLLMLKNYNTINLDKIGLCFFTTTVITLSFLTTILLRDNYGIFHVILMLVTAWASDVAALFTGMLFGKHKLAPVISPKKTVEGAIGGLLISVAISMGLIYCYQYFGGFRNAIIEINYLHAFIACICCAIISVFGDLSFSIIKRHCNIKDFGNIMPGHGGVLDRFDSIIFVSPFLFLYVYFFPILV